MFKVNNEQVKNTKMLNFVRGILRTEENFNFSENSSIFNVVVPATAF